MNEPIFVICDRMAALQTLFHDDLEGGKRSPAVVLEMAKAILSDSDLLQAMQDVGYFPRNMPIDQPATRRGASRRT